VEEKYGVRPDQVASYKGLCGDSSDNLPGVLGIGPKGAATLLQEHDSLVGIYKHLEGIKPSWKEKLERDREQAFFCERMATLVDDIALPTSLDETKLVDLPYRAVLDYCSELEFTALVKRFQALAESPYGLMRFRTEDLQDIEPVMMKGEEQMSLL